MAARSFCKPVQSLGRIEMSLRNILLPILACAALLAQPKPGAIEGTVVNSATRAPIPKATVSFASGKAWPDMRPGAPQYSREAVSDGAGRFRIVDVEPGPYHLEFVHAPGYEFQPNQAAPVTVAEEQRVTGIVLELLPLGVISGKIIDSDGEPLPFAQVAVMEYRYSERHQNTSHHRWRHYQ